MPIVKLCTYCHNQIDPKGDYVEVVKEHQSTPQQIAHVKCYQEHFKQMERPSRVTPPYA